MSGLDAVSGSGSQSLVQLLQQLAQKNATSQADGTQTASTLASLGSSAAGSVNDQGMDALHQKIETAVSSALQKLDKSSTPDQIMSAIHDAVDTTLKDNGIDPANFKQGVTASQQGQGPNGAGGAGAVQHHHHGHHGQGMAGAAGSQQQPGGDAQAPQSWLDQLLAANGFDPQQFHAALQAERQGGAQQAGGATTVSFLSALQSSSGVNVEA